LLDQGYGTPDQKVEATMVRGLTMITQAALVLAAGEVV